jgi:uncharacterized damage-inducible protein DinB
MTELQKISSLFKDLYDGSPWLEVTLAGSLSEVSAADAAAHPVPGCHSVWELVVHLTEWRHNVLRRIKGETILTPDHNYFEPVTDTSKEAWAAALQALAASQEMWTDTLSNYAPEDLELRYPVNGMSYYQHIQGILQHDAYHLGQIVLLRKVLTAK